MTAYNSYDGSPCSASDYLQNQVLKRDLGFRGVVISDACGVGGANVLHFTASDWQEAGANALAAGLDVIFQTSFDHYELFAPPFRNGRIRDAVIDSAVARVLRLKFDLGLFDDPYVPSDLWPPPPSDASRRLARSASERSMVLLKNEGGTLPLSEGIGSLAVIGPEADTVRLGDYSAPCSRPFVTVPAMSLGHVPHDKIVPGLRGEYSCNARLEGPPCRTRIDAEIQFDWTLFSPDPEVLLHDEGDGTSRRACLSVRRCGGGGGYRRGGVPGPGKPVPAGPAGRADSAGVGAGKTDGGDSHRRERDHDAGMVT